MQFNNLSNAILYLAQEMTKRTNIIEISIPLKNYDFKYIGNAMLTQAMSNDLVLENNEVYGDYLWYSVTTLNFTYSTSENILTYKFIINYYDTAEQEQQVEDTINNLITTLGLNSKTNAERCKIVYEWLANNCVYDKTTREVTNTTETGTVQASILRNSAWDALVNKASVCQGFTNAYFRFMNKLGVKTRDIQGYELNENRDLYTHIWCCNQIDNKWYLTCPTSAVHYRNGKMQGSGLDDWLLKNYKDFNTNPIKYIELPDFKIRSFKRNHMIASTSYTFS